MLNMNQNAITPCYNKFPPKERLFFTQMDNEIAQLRKQLDLKIKSFYQSELGKNDADYPLVIQNNKPTPMGVELYESCTPSESYKKCKKSYDEMVKISEYYRLYALHKDEIYKIIKKNRVYGLCFDNEFYHSLYNYLMEGVLYGKNHIKPQKASILNMYNNMGDSIERFYCVAENYLYKRTAIDLFSQLKAEANDFFEFYKYTEVNTLLLGVHECDFVCRIWGDNNQFYIVLNHKDKIYIATTSVNAEKANIFSCNTPYSFNLLNIDVFTEDSLNEYIKDSLYEYIMFQFFLIGALTYKNMRQKRCVYEIVDGMNDTTYKNNKVDAIGDSEEPITRYVHVLRDGEVKHSKINVGRKGDCKDRMYCTPQWPRKSYTRIHFGREEHIAATTCHRKGEVHERPKLLIFS